LTHKVKDGKDVSDIKESICKGLEWC